MLKTYRHPGGWLIAPIHYSLDSEKDMTWVVSERAKLDAQDDWDREMECDMRSIAGVAAYGNWNETLHINPNLTMIPSLPLCLACDFNVSPMVWMVCQVFRRVIHVLEEVVGRGIAIPALMVEFRNKYPTHTAELWMYGDAAGHSRHPQTAMSDYDLMRLGLQGYPVPVVWKVPTANPLVKDRLAAMNNCLRDTDGRVWVQVHPRCTMFIADMQEVVKDANGGIFKIQDRLNPYHERTHASDGVGYLCVREFPVASLVFQGQRTRRKPLQYGRLLGEL